MLENEEYKAWVLLNKLNVQSSNRIITGKQKMDKSL